MQKSTLYLINSNIMCNKNHWIRLYEILFKALAILEWETQLNQIIYYRHNLQYLNHQIYHQCMYIYGYIILNHKNIKFLFLLTRQKKEFSRAKKLWIATFLVSCLFLWKARKNIIIKNILFLFYIFSSLFDVRIID